MQFCDDFNLIISNCEAYNGAESVYMQQARQLEAEFYNLVDVYFDDSEIDVQRHLSKMTTPPREPTTYSPGAGGKGTPKTPKATGDDGDSGSLAADVIIQDDEREETPVSDQDNGISEISNCCVTMLYLCAASNNLVVASKIFYVQCIVLLYFFSHTGIVYHKLTILSLTHTCTLGTG